MPTETPVSLVDIVVDAARLTAEIYRHNAIKIGKGDHAPHISMSEMRRAALMDELAKDDNLCEMLAGRIHQILHGVPRK